MTKLNSHTKAWRRAAPRVTTALIFQRLGWLLLSTRRMETIR